MSSLSNHFVLSEIINITHIRKDKSDYLIINNYSINYKDLNLNPPYLFGENIKFHTNYYQFVCMEAIPWYYHETKIYNAVFTYVDKNKSDTLKFAVFFEFQKEFDMNYFEEFEDIKIELKPLSWWRKLLCF